MTAYLILLIQNIANSALNLVLAIVCLWAAIHASTTPANAFVAFGRRTKNFWLVILWLSVLFTIGSGIASISYLLHLVGINLPLFNFVRPLAIGNFFGLLMFAVPGVYLTGDKVRVDAFRQRQKGTGPYQQRPGKGPRDW
ncbi:hypothetical protein BK816_01505 [Boudabousia tangfeifanii]|uniref:Uncharacterized protein n=1 Tax=Boudabousia tangfeifanii TaxID=1912795 RepID=A0A1D9MIL9_9ACTO|nr:DUF2516 family protein [Boudabousia tangfeifanii]AOZ72134.1 hypothetical protein BK816_01505 [Boudabousia tangfeifanii]